jgi:hypothetical protein
MAFYTGVLNRIMRVTDERIAEAMEETRLSEKFKACINKIDVKRPKETITAAVEANKELASWAGIERTELSSLQKEEYMSRKELREGIEGINRKAMKHIHKKVSGIKSIRYLERQDEALLVKITRRVRQISDTLVAIEKIASDLAHGKVDYGEATKLSRELDAAKAELNSALFYLSKHLKTLRSTYSMEKRLVPAPA